MTTTLVTILVNGAPHQVPADVSVAIALLQAGVTCFRTSVDGERRAPICGMGVCYECRVTIDGAPHQRSCLIPCADGMRVDTPEDPHA